ncbi:MFS transporter [Rhodoferax koreense]|uniref:MFS transporter n=1 Tax=Rhodoferax koreensis TaxID=1842727 RepID=A0A1P8JVX6_9BURK|nr:MFS transporter [Rhodoferax koreense]APW37929.1 MFS transporter [Rhodoferax koreense]
MLVQDGLPTPARYHAMGVIILGIALSVLDGTIVNLALPGIARDLHVTAPQTVWVVNAYQVATLGLLLPCAALGDQIGYRRVYLWGLSLFTLASLGCVMANSLAGLVAARALQGLGAAGIMAVNGALVRLIYPRKLFGRGVAINSMVVAFASVAGPTVAAAILSIAPWPWLFALNVPLGVVVLILGRSSLPVNAPRHGEPIRIAPLDVLLNALMFGLVFLGADALGTRVAAGGGAAEAAGPVIMLLVGLAIGVFYVRRQLQLEKCQATPVFPLDLLRIPVFALSMCTSVGAFAAQMLAYIALPFLLLDTYGLSHLKTGALITAWPVAIVVVAPIVGRLIGRIPDGLLGGIGLGLLACGLALLAALPAQPSDLAIASRMALCGAGFAVFQSPNNHTILTSAPAHRSGGASGMLGTARLTGQTLGAVLLAIIFTVVDAHGGRGPVLALALAAGFAATAGLFSSLRLRHAPVHANL